MESCDTVAECTLPCVSYEVLKCLTFLPLILYRGHVLKILHMGI